MELFDEVVDLRFFFQFYSFHEALFELHCGFFCSFDLVFRISDADEVQGDCPLLNPLKDLAEALSFPFLGIPRVDVFVGSPSRYHLDLEAFDYFEHLRHEGPGAVVHPPCE